MFKKFDRILPICTLLVTLLLLVMVAMAWYVSNDTVTASGITGATQGENYTLTLERGQYDETNVYENLFFDLYTNLNDYPQRSQHYIFIQYDETNGWTWHKVDELSFTNVTPGNAFYFRIKLDTNGNLDEPINLSASFDGVSSELIPNKLQILNGYVCTSDGYALYEIVNNQVLIDGKVLYDCTNGTIKLDDYLIQDTFRFYSFDLLFPINATDEYHIGKSSTKLSSLPKFDITVEESDLDAANNAYYYFALEFNEEDSLVQMPNSSVPTSNCYLYQKFIISEVAISKE